MIGYIDTTICIYKTRECVDFFVCVCVCVFKSNGASQKEEEVSDEVRVDKWKSETTLGLTKIVNDLGAFVLINLGKAKGITGI